MTAIPLLPGMIDPHAKPDIELQPTNLPDPPPVENAGGES